MPPKRCLERKEPSKPLFDCGVDSSFLTKDLWKTVFSFVDHFQLRKLPLVCKMFNDIVKSDPLLLTRAKPPIINWMDDQRDWEVFSCLFHSKFDLTYPHCDKNMFKEYPQSCRKYLDLLENAKGERWRCIYEGKLIESDFINDGLDLMDEALNDGAFRLVFESIDSGCLLYIDQFLGQGVIGFETKTDGILAYVLGGHPGLCCCDFSYVNSDGSGPVFQANVHPDDEVDWDDFSIPDPNLCNPSDVIVNFKEHLVHFFNNEHH